MAEIISTDESDQRWDRVASEVDLRTSAASGRALRVDASDSLLRPALAIFIDSMSTLYAIQDACPHAGHPLSNGDILQAGDIEDISPTCGIRLVVACPAHTFTYDTSTGVCLSDPISGRTARRWEVKLEDGGVYIGAAMPPSATRPSLSKDENDRIQMKIVVQALDRKYGPE